MQSKHLLYIELTIYGRVMSEAKFILENRSTIRGTAQALKVPRSTVHNDLAKHLPKIDIELYYKVSELIAVNKADRSYRGGNATRLRCLRLRGER